MARQKRYNRKKDLLKVPVFIEETGITSKYFQIYDVPEELPMGKSSFLIGGSQLLVPQIKLYTEIIDSKGGVIYTQPVFGYTEGTSKRIAIEVYEDTPPGRCQLVVLGEIDSSKVDFNIPEEFRGKYNLRYTRDLSVNLTIPNTLPIRFYRTPKATIQANSKGVLELDVKPTDTVTLTGIGKPKSHVTSELPITNIDGSITYPGIDSRTKNIRAIIEQNKASSKEGGGGNFLTLPPTQQDPPGDYTLSLSSIVKAEVSMIGQEVLINSPSVDYGNSEISSNESHLYNVPSAFSSSVLDVTDENTITLLDSFYVTKKGEEPPTKIPAALESVSITATRQIEGTAVESVFNFYDVADMLLTDLRNFSGDVNKVRIFTRSDAAQNPSQWNFIKEIFLEAKEELYDTGSLLRSGNMGYFINQDKIDDHWQGYSGEFGVTSNGAISLTRDNSKIMNAMDISGSNRPFQHDLLVQSKKPMSLQKNVRYAASMKIYGDAKSKLKGATTDTTKGKLQIFISGSGIPANTDLPQNYGRLIGNLELPSDESNGQGSYNFDLVEAAYISKVETNAFLQLRMSSGRWKVAEISVKPATSTNFSPEVFKCYAELPVAQQRPDFYQFLIEFYDVNNNKADTTAISERVKFDGANLTIQGEDNLLSGSMFIGNTLLSGIEAGGGGSAFIRSLGYFGFDKAESLASGGFMIWSGSVIKDHETYDGVGLELHNDETSDSGNDSYLQFRTKDPTGNSLFKVKTDKFFFGGTTQFVSGSDGNIEISSSNFHLQPDGDVIMAGTISASAGNIGTWTINSTNLASPDGGVVLDATNKAVYVNDTVFGNTGIQLQYNSGTPRFFAGKSTGGFVKFDGSNVHLSSSAFMLGDIGSTYVSGALGNLEISSSNFHLTTDGNVTMSGTITAEAGYIAGWQIIGDVLSGSNVTLDAAGAGLYKSDAGPDAFPMSGYYIDFTPGTNYYIRMGSHFAVSSSGVLIASGAQIEGQLTASSGLIANWNIGSDAIYKYTTSNTWTGMSSTGPTRFFAGSTTLAASGSAPFNVKESGEITASSGLIGGWSLSSNSLISPNSRMTMSANPGNERITVRKSTGSAADTNFEMVRIGEISDAAGDLYGIKVYDGTGVYNDDTKEGQVVLLGEQGNMIGGWEVTDTQIRSIPDAGFGGKFVEGENGLILHSSGRLESADFATNLKGWRIDSLGNGTAEFENCRIRGTLSTAVFEKESVNVVGGQLMVANASAMGALKSGSIIIAGSETASATAITMSMDNVSGFAPGEIIKAKVVGSTGFSVEYLQVTGSMRFSHPSSSVSESLAGYDLGAIDPDGLAGEIYVGRSVGAIVAISESISTITEPMTQLAISGSTDRITVASSASFSTQQIIKIDDERMKITQADGLGQFSAANTMGVIRDYNDTDNMAHADNSDIYVIDSDKEFLAGLVSTAQPYNAGQVFVSTGKYDTNGRGSGYILMNANPNDMSTPYIDIVERTGSGVYDLSLKTRIGDLSGLSSAYLYGDNEPGFGIYTENGFFSGAITAQTGSFAGIVHVATVQGGLETGEKISIGRQVSGENDGFYINNNNYWYTTGAWKVGGGTNFISLDNATAGNITIASQTFNLDATDLDISSTNKRISIGHDAGNGSIVLQGGSTSYIEVGAANKLTLKTDATDQFMVFGSKTSFTEFDQTTAGFIMGMDGSTPKFELVGSSGEFISFDGANLSMNGSITITGGSGAGNAGANQTFRQASAPTATAVGDIWYDSDDGDKPYRASATGTGNWVAVPDGTIATAQALAASKNEIFRQTSTPTAVTIGDQWYDTDDGNKLYVATATGTGNWVATVDGTIATAQSTANTAETNAQTGISNAATAQTQANTATTNAATAQSAIDTMETQVVLDSTGMELRASNDGANAYQKIAKYGTTTYFYDGTTSENVKLQLQAAGITAYGDNTTTYATFNASGVTLVDDNVTTGTFTAGTVTLYGASSNDRIVLNNTGLSIYSNNVLRASALDAGFTAYGDNATTYTSMTSAGITIVDNSVTTGTFTSGTVTLYGASSNDRIVLNNTGLSIYSNNVLRASALDAGFTAYGDNLTTYTTMNSSGLTIVDNSFTQGTFSGGVVTLYGDNATTYSRINSSGLTIVDNSVTTGTFTSGTVTLYGASSDDRVVINNTGMSVYTNNVLKASALDAGFTAYGDDVNTYATVTSTGLTIFEDSTDMANFGSTMRVGVDATDKSALRVAADGTLTIGTSNTTGVTITAAGAATFTGTVTATLGSIGGWTIGSNTLTTTGAGIGKTGQNQAFWAGSDTQNSAEFRVSHAGALVATSATIAGDISANTGYFLDVIAGGGIIEPVSGRKAVESWYDTDVSTTIEIATNSSNLGEWGSYTVAFSGTNHSNVPSSITALILDAYATGSSTKISTALTDWVGEASELPYPDFSKGIRPQSAANDFTDYRQQSRMGGTDGSNSFTHPVCAFFRGSNSSPRAWMLASEYSTIDNFSDQQDLTMTITSPTLDLSPHKDLPINFQMGIKLLGTFVDFGDQYATLKVDLLRASDDVVMFTQTIAIGDGSPANTYLAWHDITFGDIMTTLGNNDCKVKITFTGAEKSGGSENTEFYGFMVTEMRFKKRSEFMSGIECQDISIQRQASFQESSGYRDPVTVELKDINTSGNAASDYKFLIDLDSSIEMKIQGAVEATGNITAYSSDERLKENIIPITNSIDKVKKIRGVTFDWTDESKELGFIPDNKHEHGLIAQDVEVIIPDAVAPAPFNNEYKTVRYERLIPLLFSAIQEQQKQIDELKEKLKRL